jgi:septum formation protein
LTLVNLPPIILASASPRRSELLKQARLEFQVAVSEALELTEPQLTARELAQGNAYRKARAVAEQFPHALVLGADTLVCLEGEVFGKPRDLTDAQRMLGRLGGRTHQVVTGVCLIHWLEKRTRVFSECTNVSFKRLHERDIDEYLSSINPLDKAGAYAIQEGGERLVEAISGSYSNVVGLPVERVQRELASWARSADGTGIGAPAV